MMLSLFRGLVFFVELHHGNGGEHFDTSTWSLFVHLAPICDATDIKEHCRCTLV